MDMIKNYIDAKPKLIVLTRDIDEIVQSFASLYAKNKQQFNREDLMVDGSEPLMRSLEGVNYARENNEGEFFFIDYASLVDDTDAVIDELYKFLELDRYAHDLSNIINENQENDAVYGLLGMHEVRNTISKR